MEIFSNGECRTIIDYAQRLPLRRAQLLNGLPNLVVARLSADGNWFDLANSDVFTLNRIPSVDGVVPIEQWLRNAQSADPCNPDAQKLFREFADLALSRAAPPPAADSPPEQAAVAAAELDNIIPERLLWESDLLPIGFLSGAVRTAASVVRVCVKRHDNGNLRISPATGLPTRYFGTGWLLGRNCIITNHHVINARSPGEADASATDFDLQALNSSVEFDYDDLNSPPPSIACTRLIASDRTLDFAILELDAAKLPLNRPPLPLSTVPVVIDQGTYLPVNIIQHPGGQTKQIAIRNNLAARIDGINLSYFTDTEAGSSGSPVCNDQWHVIALHKAAVKHQTKFKYQGRDTAWVNVGTPITLIVDKLKELKVWNQIQTPV